MPVYVADVKNNSPRPIWDVAARIRPLPMQDYDWEATMVGELVPSAAALRGNLYEVPSLSKVPLIRTGALWELFFLDSVGR